MAKQELRKLNRTELLELLVMQTERADRLTEDLQEAKAQIRNREDLIRQAGELAGVASRLISMLEDDSAATVRQNAKPEQRSKPQTKAAKDQQKAVVAKAKKLEPEPQTELVTEKVIAVGYSWADAIKNVNRENARKAATVQKKKSTLIKDTKHEKNGIDPSAIIAITSGIGKGKI